MSTQQTTITAYFPLGFSPLYQQPINTPTLTVAPVRWFVYRKAQRHGNWVYFLNSYTSREEAKRRAVALTEQQKRVVPRWMRKQRDHYHVGPAPLGTTPLDFFLRLHPVDVTTEVF